MNGGNGEIDTGVDDGEGIATAARLLSSTRLAVFVVCMYPLYGERVDSAVGHSTSSPRSFRPQGMAEMKRRREHDRSRRRREAGRRSLSHCIGGVGWDGNILY